MNSSAPYNFTQLNPYDYTNTNCNDMMEIWSYFQYNTTGEYKYYYGYDTEDTVYQSIIRGFEAIRNGSLEAPPKDQSFWDWAVDGGALRWTLSTDGWDRCPAEMCKIIGWEGSPDLAGVGMLATYIIQAILITVYLCAILMVNLYQQPNQSWMWPPLSRILCAVLDTTREFLSTSAIFSLALLVASVCSITQIEAYQSSTTWILLLVIPLYSVLAVFVLHLAAWEILQRYKGRVLVLLIMEVMVIVLAARSSVYYYDVNPSRDESPCLKVKSFKSMAILSWTVAGFLCLSVTAYLVDFLISMVRRRPGLFERLSSTIRWAVIGAGLCMMWYLIGWFVKLTLDIRSRAGDNNGDNKWTFGQVLALSTWAPFLIEFGYNIWEGPKKAHEAHSNYPSKSALQGSFAMRSPGEDEERGKFALLE
ncbi:unnamed protein product [Alternaria alternata]